MILRLSPRIAGRQVHVLIRSGDSSKSMGTNGLLTFNVSEYRAFLDVIRQGSAMTSPNLTLEVDSMQLGCG